MGERPAAGGGRWLEVSPERIGGWLAGFDARHRVVRTRYAEVVTFEAADGAIAECHPPFPPLAASSEVGGGQGGGHEGMLAGPLVEHALRPRTVGVLLARLGGHAAGVFEGERLVASKVGSRQVHGRTAAGGRSQHRFARRREGQAAKAAAAAADDAAPILVPRLRALDGVVLGGERRAVDALRTDRRLAGVFALATERFLTTPDPRLVVLKACPPEFRAVRIRLVEPAATDQDNPIDTEPGRQAQAL
jgi:hypothetical protein